MKYLKTYKLFELKSIKYINYTKRGLMVLPELPDDCIYLDCSENYLTKLPKLPKTLTGLSCFMNKITELPELPSNLRTLDCCHNKLKYLPEIPDSLTSLICYINDWAEPIKSEIAIRFDLYNLYNNEQLDRFNSEEYQREFLTKYPERFQDLTFKKLNIHPIIRKEFAYLFEGEDMGFFKLKTEM